MNSKRLFSIISFIIIFIFINLIFIYYIMVPIINKEIKSTMASINIKNNTTLIDEKEVQKYIFNEIDKIENFKDYNMAILLLTNGLNRNPDDVLLIDKIKEVALKSDNQDIINNVKRSLEVLAYKSKPQNVKYILDNIAILEKSIKTDEIVVSEKQDSKEVEKYYLELIGTIQKNKDNEDLLVIEKLRNDISNGPDYSLIENNNLKEEIEKEAKKLNAILFIITSLNNMENQLKIIEQEASNKDPNLSLIDNVLAYINSAIPSLLSYDDEYFSDNIMRRIKTVSIKAADIPTKIAREAEKKQYETIIVKIENIEKNLVKKTYTENIKYASIQIEEISSLIGSLTFQDYLLEVNKKMRIINQKIVSLNQKRYQAYQKWALKKCVDSMEHLDSLKLFTNKDALYVFDHYYIYQVDQSVLAPEISTIYSRLISRLTGEVSAKQAFEMEKKMANIENKKKIEEF